MTIKNENFITIHAWMISRLGLSGASLIIYAVIFGFSQDGESYFRGSRQYLADWCNCSLSGVKKCLKQLQEIGLIEQVHHSKDNQEVFYRANMEPRTQNDLGHKVTEARSQSDRGVGSKVTEARSQSVPANKDNIDDNIADNIVDNIECDIVVCETTKPTRFKKPTFEEVKQYIEEHGYSSVDPDRFYSYYEANGWKVGRNSMKDFKAAIRMWSARDKKEQKKRQSRPGYQRDRYGVEYMVNDYDQHHLDEKEQATKDLVDRLLSED